MREDPIINAPIQGLQLMLRTIAFATGEIPAVIPDGVFGPSTEAAVTAFQKIYGLPVTGVVDEETFRVIVNAYDLADELLSLSEAAVLHFPSGLVIKSEQSHPHLRLAQSIFQALHQEFPAFKAAAATGILDAATTENLRIFQALSGLEITGRLDKSTWGRLNQFYRGLFDRNLAPAQG